MPNIILDANVSICADDHRVFVAKETKKSVERILVENGERMTKGTKKIFWKSISSYGLGNPKGERKVDLDICGKKVEQTETIKALGVNLDDNLNFRDHIRRVCKKMDGMVGILRRLKNLIPVNAKVLLYKSAIMPHLTYCYLVWHFVRHLIVVNWSVYKKEL